MIGVVAIASNVLGALGHGGMINPVPRNYGHHLEMLKLDFNEHFWHVDGCRGVECYWYQQSCCCGQSKCSGIGRNTCAEGNFEGGNETLMPAACPGQAPVDDPCGVFAGPQQNFDVAVEKGSDLQETAATMWVPGTQQKVRSQILVNHGGVYQYRLCPKSRSLSEACFQDNVLQFAGAAKNHWRDISPNPVPNDDLTPVDLSDSVVVPNEVGQYVLQWRYDSKHTAQVWANCADIEISSGPTPSPTPSPIKIIIIISIILITIIIIMFVVKKAFGWRGSATSTLSQGDAML